MRRLERVSERTILFLLYPVLALFTFPVIGAILAGQNGPAYALDVFDDGGEVPRLSIVAHDWLTNGLTLWDPHLTAGNALLGQFSISPFALDSVLALVIGPFAAWIAVSWLMPVVAGMAMHLFLRDTLSLPRPAVLGGSILYMFSSWHYNYGFSILLLPFFLWLADRAIGPRGSWRQVVIGAAIGAVALYEGLSQCVLLAAAIQLAFVLVVRADQSRRARLIRWLAMWAGAFALYGPVLMTQFVTLQDSQRSIWDLIYLFNPTLSNAAATVVHHYAAVLTAIPLGAGFGPGEYRYGTLFLGGLGLPLLALGIVAGRRDRKTLFVMALLVVIPVLDFAAILVTPLQQHLDAFLKTFQFVRIRHFYPFAVTAVAALGIDALVGLERRWRESPGRLAMVLLSFAPVLVELAIAVRHVRRAATVTAAQAQLQSGWLLTVGALAIGVLSAVVVAVIVVRRSSVPTGRWAAALLVVGLMLVSERALYASGSALMGPNISSYGAALAETAGERFLAAQPGIDEDRVLTFGDQANRMVTPGFLQVDGYQAVYPLTYHDFFGKLIEPQLESNSAQAAYFNKWGARAYAFGPGVNPNLVSLAGVRWLYVRGGQLPTVPGIVARFQSGDVTVYENPAVLPRAFVAGAINVAPTSAASLDALSRASATDLRGQAYAVAGPDLDALQAAIPGGLASVPGTAGSATITSATPDRVEIHVDADRAGLLVLTDVMAPGWVASVNGRAAPIATVDGAFRGVAVAAGTTDVVFQYRPWFTYLGFAMAGLAAVVLVVWAAWCARRERRAEHP